MLKFQPLVTTGAALCLVFPAAVLGDADLSSLGQALKETERALDVLRGLESGRSQPQNPAAVLRELTEAPISDGPKRSEKLERLRNEVGLLQTELDALDLRALDPSAAAHLPAYGIGPSNLDVPSPADGLGDATETSGSTSHTPDSSTGAVTTGLTAAQRAALFGGTADDDEDGSQPFGAGSTVATQGSTAEQGAAPAGPGGDDASEPAAAGKAPKAGEATSGRETAPPKAGPEDPATTAPSGAPGYSADPVKHASALYRAGRFQEGFALIAKRTEPDAVYQQARFLEKLGRLDEAIAALESIDGKLPEGYEARRAESDLDFFRWKRDFLKRIPESGSSTGDGR